MRKLAIGFMLCVILGIGVMSFVQMQAFMLITSSPNYVEQVKAGFGYSCSDNPNDFISLGCKKSLTKRF